MSSLDRGRILHPASTCKDPPSYRSAPTACKRRDSLSLMSPRVKQRRIARTRTLQNTLQDRVDGIPWHYLSEKFQDAVTITRELGLRYLWIDSLCIVQDDPKDWARESGQMAPIYEGTKVILAASDAQDGHDGFLSSCPDSAVPKSIFEGNKSNGDSYLVRIRKGDYHRWYGDALPPRSRVQPDSSPLSARGWAFQERLLAARYVQLRSQELIWECRLCGVNAELWPRHPSSARLCRRKPSTSP
jgi:hypothetical protein